MDMSPGFERLPGIDQPRRRPTWRGAALLGAAIVAAAGAALAFAAASGFAFLDSAGAAFGP